MQKVEQTKHWLWTEISLALIVVLASLMLSPGMVHQWADSAAYATIAQVIRDGGMPYRDAWDHKPPLTYYLYVLIFTLAGENHWALWGLRTLCIWITARLIQTVLEKLEIRWQLAFGGAVITALVLGRLDWEGIDTPELYALPVQLLCLLAGERLLDNPHRRWALIMGLMAGLAVLTKPTIVGTPLMFIPAVWITQRYWIKQHRGNLIMIGIGGILPLVLTGCYFAAHGVLDEALDAVLVYNRLHTGPISPLAMIRSTLRAPAILQIYLPLAFFVGIGLVQVVRGELCRSRFTPILPSNFESKQSHVLMLWIALSGAVDLGLANLTARGYGHYFLTPLPAWIMLVIIGAEVWLDAPWTTSSGRVVRRITAAFFVLVIVFPLLIQGVYLALIDGRPVIGPERRFPAVPYIKEHTTPQDYVLVWGHAADVNFGADRRSPTRYFYSLPLLMPGYNQEARIHEFLDDLQDHPPRLIVDTSFYDVGRVPPLDPAWLAVWQAAGGSRNLPELSTVYAFVREHCALETEIKQIRLYRCE